MKSPNETPATRGRGRGRGRGAAAAVTRGGGVAAGGAGFRRSSESMSEPNKAGTSIFDWPDMDEAEDPAAAPVPPKKTAAPTAGKTHEDIKRMLEEDMKMEAEVARSKRESESETESATSATSRHRRSTGSSHKSASAKEDQVEMPPSAADIVLTKAAKPEILQNQDQLIVTTTSTPSAPLCPTNVINVGSLSMSPATSASAPMSPSKSLGPLSVTPVGRGGASITPARPQCQPTVLHPRSGAPAPIIPGGVTVSSVIRQPQQPQQPAPQPQVPAAPSPQPALSLVQLPTQPIPPSEIRTTKQVLLEQKPSSPKISIPAEVA